MINIEEISLISNGFIFITFNVGEEKRYVECCCGLLCTASPEEKFLSKYNRGILKFCMCMNIGLNHEIYMLNKF